ncbi:MAG TPA: class I SAM-dependent methyltransferase [Terriglobia bacterium]|nr:class I SAM-dependent methyltransferase [Terriglobia bacterium]
MPRSISCRSCGGSRLTLILSLGCTPLANSLLTPEELRFPEPTYPLDVAFCPDCSLVQITESVPPEKLFREYLYFSSFSDALLQHARALVERLVLARGLGPQNLVMEIASNDGYLLQYYHQKGIPVLGIEPAINIARKAESERGIRTVCEFFGKDLAQVLRNRGERADVLHANNVLAHVPDLNGVVSGIQTVLKDTGVAIIEVPYLKDMMDHVEFDTTYHEHLCYFTLTALDRIFSRHGLLIQDVERLQIHGGSLRLFAVPAGQAQRKPRTTALLEEEAAWGVARLEAYAGFAQRVEKVKTDLVAMLGDLKRQGKRLAAYGAAAKGSTLLNYCGIGTETLEFVVDRSTYKQGRFMPGMHLPIYPPSKLLDAMPDYVVMLTWNFAEEILAQQAEYTRRGGRFIVPLPTPKVL